MFIQEFHFFHLWLTAMRLWDSRSSHSDTGIKRLSRASLKLHNFIKHDRKIEDGICIRNTWLFKKGILNVAACHQALNLDIQRGMDLSLNIAHHDFCIIMHPGILFYSEYWINTFSTNLSIQKKEIREEGYGELAGWSI